jgi:hypothetical protein
MVTSPMNAKIPQALKNGIRRRLNCINSIMVENDALGQLKPVPATLTYQYMLRNGRRNGKKEKAKERDVRKGHDECSQI